ncbi:MAG: MGH1-like glycoside hydrolase domain-containing protein, partial [Acidimicrobiia bacterium]
TGELELSSEHARLTFSYRRGSFRRRSLVDFSKTPRIEGRIVSFELIVPPRGEWSTCIQVTPVLDGRAVEPRYRCGEPVDRAKPAERLHSWRRQLPTVTTDHEGLALLLRRSTEDLAALRIFDPEHPDRAVVAAGAPWFMTLFGRDSLITSWMAMMIDPQLALGTLQTLARFQGRDSNPLTEEEPGRILHEMRSGETAASSLGGGRLYYGTADATPLFVMVLGELQRWGGRRGDVDALLPAADRALRWIDEYGDRDGDGYVEYERSSDRGLRNQAWKDSWDSMRFSDGSLAKTPLAACEVQAYVYAAFVARAHFATEAGETDLAERLLKRAAALKEAFNRDFWLEEQEYFALGLDADKKPLDVVTSNAGHCLWTGIVDEEKAPLVARRLLSDDLFSGWGVRTLAESTRGYNPVSYHNGSVWPHDSAIAAAGLMRYGFVEEAHRIIEGMMAMAPFLGGRLPELFAGLARQAYQFPVSYPTSCSPQAWAAAAPLLMLRTMLRFEPDVRNSLVHLAPAVPDSIRTLRLEQIPLLGGSLSVEVLNGRLSLLEVPEGLTVVNSPRSATS